MGNHSFVRIVLPSGNHPDVEKAQLKQLGHQFESARKKTGASIVNVTPEHGDTDGQHVYCLKVRGDMHPKQQRLVGNLAYTPSV